MSLICQTEAALVEAEIDRVRTQYRESPNLLFMARTYLGKVAEAISAVCVIPSYFDLDTATGDQLTLLGKRLGWGRCHCVCDSQPVFGFECEGRVSLVPIVGFCTGEVTWAACGEAGAAEICLADDEIYRRFLKVRRYQAIGLYDLESLTAAVKEMWGATATVMDAYAGRIVMAPGRALTSAETAVLQLVPRVMPIAPGISQRFHFGTDLRVFGFGDGWGGFAELLDPPSTVAYERTGKIFGFECEGGDPRIGGFCEDWLDDGQQILTELGSELITEDGDEITTGPITEHASWLCPVDAPWMCQIDVRPYSC